MSVSPTVDRALPANKGSSRAIKRIHLLLSVQSLVVILGSINRLSSLTTGYVAPNQFLRWVDLNNMLVLPLISLLAFYLLKKELEQGNSHLLLGILFICGVYLLGASYGDHEVTNYLHGRFCLDIESDICRIIRYNDDQFSHLIFFIGFVLVNGALLLLQARSRWPGPARRNDLWLLAANGLFIALGIMANLAFEEIGFDLVVIVLLALLSGVLLRRHGRLPLLVYYCTAYSVGLLLTVVVRLLR